MRVLPHLLLPRSALHRRFPSHALTAIENAIEASEKTHSAEIRIAIEVAIELKALLRLRTARERALEVFAELGVWNTRESNGCKNRGKYAESSTLPTGMPPGVRPCLRPMGEMDQ